ncbi:MAG TPA: urocanate hydratase [Tissierellia bacterium]|nr:urocanate hydratase [Tissierellia bacterium]
MNLTFDRLPEQPEFVPGIRRAPRRTVHLSQAEKDLAVKNALRYIPPQFHEEISPEFYQELEEHGRIYGYRFRPAGELYGKPIDEYPGKITEAKAIQVMIDNNLDFAVALYPYELVTYGETGQIFQNWMQYHLVKQYLAELEADETLVLLSGHPLGVFKSTEEAPRLMITNGLMVGQYDNQDDWNKAAALGVANYGQMTAGGMMYIGPQGIVHGTYNTLLNASRMQDHDNMEGLLFITSGLGGMSGAQGKAVKIAGGVGIIAEVDLSRVMTRLDQGWIDDYSADLETVVSKALAAKQAKQALALAYHGNVVDLLEYVFEHDIAVELLSDQTSCHVPYDGGYCPAGIDFEERTRMLDEEPERFHQLVDHSLRRHYEIILKLTQRGSYFFDYGNAFMKAIYDAGVSEITRNGRDESDGFIWPSYVEDIMGPMLFDYGYGPFRWVCLSGKPEDLRATDQAAMAQIDKDRRFQDYDNWAWIRDAEENALVVGTQARILYQDEVGRVNIALAFNQMIREGQIGPVMLGRDHHDTGGTDSPFRETANIYDGSKVMADMATQSFAGNAARGMTMVALHNGGGVGIGKSINGGFGLVLDGSERVDRIIRRAMSWDVMVGVARRGWARNLHAIETLEEFNQSGRGKVTIPYRSEE